MKSILIIVQARTGSSRFPKKILSDILGKPVLLRQLERMSNISTAANIVVATSRQLEDNIIENICLKEGYKVYRGDLYNLLDRHYKAAKSFEAEIIVKIPSDCPLIDPRIIDKVLNYYLMHSDKYDFVSNLHPASYPDGNDVEVMSFKALELTWHQAEKQHELEHTTPYIWDNPDKFRIGNVEWNKGIDFSKSHRWTLDYPEDYQFIKSVFEELYHKNSCFSIDDILELLDKKPELKDINHRYAGEFWYNRYAFKQNSLNNPSPMNFQSNLI
jgi:spore coat polysaccharide biosynthesis protein SpsF